MANSLLVLVPHKTLHGTISILIQQLLTLKTGHAEVFVSNSRLQHTEVADAADSSKLQVREALSLQVPLSHRSHAFVRKFDRLKIQPAQFGNR